MYVRSVLEKEYGIKCDIVNEKGHDIITNDRRVKIECKSDNWITRTGNLCLELFSHVDLSNPGWMQYSDCHLLAYVHSNNGQFGKIDFYDFHDLWRVVYFKILKCDWMCDSPTIGRITSAHLNNNLHVRNLLLPKREIDRLISFDRVDMMLSKVSCLPYDDTYTIFDDGTIFSNKTNNFLSAYIHGGRYRVKMGRTDKYIDNMVAEHFVGKQSVEHKYLKHRDGNLLNNNHFNLEWSLMRNDYFIDGDITYVECDFDNGEGKGIVLIDTEDIPLVADYNWRISNKGYCYYKDNSNKSIQMHRVISKPMTGQVVHHKNRNGLCNLKSNLQNCSQANNSQNAIKREGCTSKYKGVCWDKSKGKWTAYINAHGKRIYLGRFDEEDEAARAYNKASKQLHGEFARLNSISDY